MFTRDPFSTRLPATGDWLITRPSATVALEANDGVTPRPCARRRAEAACSVSPVTFATFTCPAEEDSSSTAATIPPTTSAASRLQSSTRLMPGPSPCSPPFSS